MQFLLFGLSTKALAAPLPAGTLLTIGPGSFFTVVAGTNTITTSMTSISPNSTDGGILVLTDQSAGTGNHSGLPNYSIDFGPIDEPWDVAGQTGHHFQDLAAGGVSVDTSLGTAGMSGWRIAWNGLIVDLGTGPNGPMATVSVSGSSYTLDYAACIPEGDPSGLGGICVSENLALSSALPLSPFETAASPSDYTLHLEGTVVSAVPEPAFLALFGTGLACLVGLKRKRRK